MFQRCSFSCGGFLSRLDVSILFSLFEEKKNLIAILMEFWALNCKFISKSSIWWTFLNGDLNDKTPCIVPFSQILALLWFWKKNTVWSFISKNPKWRIFKMAAEIIIFYAFVPNLMEVLSGFTWQVHKQACELSYCSLGKCSFKLYFLIQYGGHVKWQPKNHAPNFPKKKFNRWNFLL